MPKRILQFGTSRFLQAHANLFVHEARVQGQDIGPITIVKTTLGGPRDHRTAAFGQPQGFPVHLRGTSNGRLVDEVINVKSVTRALDANWEWQKLKDIFAHETEIVFSNVGESGYALVAADGYLGDEVPQSFPAKFLALLIHRYKNGAAPLLVLPCELMSDNGKVLKNIIFDLAVKWGESDEFSNWLMASIMFCNTLVDRIVSEAIEPIGAIAEPYGLWAIERQAGFAPPFENSCVTYTDDLTTFLRLKLHILNLGHTYLAEIWQRENRSIEESVREILSDSEIHQRLLRLYQSEIIPGFAACGMQGVAEDYVSTTLERFKNPFLNHRISDIAQNHKLKIERRANDFMSWVHRHDARVEFPLLENLVTAASF
jgi:tagaturonate reductase